MEDIMSLDLFKVFPTPLLGVQTLKKDNKEVLFSLDTSLVIRIIEIHRNDDFQVILHDCNSELPYGIKPRLKSVVYCGILGESVFLLFDNFYFMIVDINQG